MGEEQPEVHRLGRRELGRHAFETHWPGRIADLVANEGDFNTLTGVIPNLSCLLQRDNDVHVAFLCNHLTAQIYKIQGEGHHFCGYRNIQMLCLTLGLSEPAPPAFASLRDKLTISQLQDLIEQAWDTGINAHGRVQTGNIKQTRKRIGTSEAEAVLLYLDIPCTGSAFEGKDACLKLFDSIEAYFVPTLSDGLSDSKVHQTELPPMFLQLPKHSVTVVGFERTKNGKRRILTFDPAYQPLSAMKSDITNASCSWWNSQRILWQYRKSENSLSRQRAFETLTVDKLT